MTRMNLTEGNFEHLKNHLKGETIYLVGSGPSLIGYDFSRLKDKKIVAVNHAIFDLIDAGCNPLYHVFLDQRFLQESEMMDSDGNFDGNLLRFSITSSNSLLSPRANLAVFKAGCKGFSMEPSVGMWSPRNSMAFGISVLAYMGVSEIYLLGCDCRFLRREEAVAMAVKNGNTKRAVEIAKSDRYWWGHYSSDKRRHNKDRPEDMNTFEYMQALFYEFKNCSAKIYNCSDISKIQCFERKPLP